MRELIFGHSLASHDTVGCSGRDLGVRGATTQHVKECQSGMTSCGNTKATLVRRSFFESLPQHSSSRRDRPEAVCHLRVRLLS